MMKIKKEVKIGVFGVLMLMLLYWGFSFLKGHDVLRRTNTYYAQFETLNGIKASSPILINGFQVGSISDISYDPTNKLSITIEFSVRSKYKIPKGSKACAFSDGLMGGMAIDIETTTSSETIADGDTLQSLTRRGMMDLAGDELEGLTVKLNTIMDQMNVTLSGLNNALTDQNVASLSASLKNIERLSAQLSNGEVKNVITNINTVSKSFADNTGKLDHIMTNFESLSDSLKSSQLPSLVASLNSIVTSIEKGEGTAGKLVNNQQLYDSLLVVSGNLSTLLEDIENNPKKYVHFSIFGRKDKTK